jgi:NAD-dependent dihydropyrimidine dehydrogenase PreA subunit
LPQIDPILCENDGACVESCPTGAIKWVSGAVESIDAGKCIFCAACVLACPKNAITMTSRVELASGKRDGLIDPFEPPALGPNAGVETLLFDPSAREHIRMRVDSRLGRSLHVRHLDAGSCNGCDWEIAALLNPYHDIQRLGIDFVASPRHADLLLVTGVMTRNLEEAARRTWSWPSAHARSAAESSPARRRFWTGPAALSRWTSTCPVARPARRQSSKGY